MKLQRYITVHPYLSYNALALPLSWVALSSTPSVASVSLLLGVLILQTTTILNRDRRQIIFLILNLAVGSTLANLSASTTALSSPASSITIALFRGAVFSFIAFIPLAIRHTITRQASTTVSPWLKTAAFPTVWAVSWMFFTSSNPVGRIGSWTPLTGDEGYRWLRQYTGFAGIDFVVAGWAEAFAGLAGLWIQGSADEDVDEHHHNGHASGEQQGLIGHPHDGTGEYGAVQNGNHQQQAAQSPRSKSTLILAAILFFLSVPSYLISPLPLPVWSESTTPVSVACVLPPHRSPNSPKTPLDLMILETRAVAPRAKIVLWPESAVSFRTSTERKEAVKVVQDTAKNNKVWIGMSFEEPANNDDKEGGHRAKLLRNGMALISPDPKEPVVFEYFKRNLVPSKSPLELHPFAERFANEALSSCFTVAETYSHIPSHDNPPFATIPLPPPPSLPKPEQRSYPRPISLTTSICLDFTQPFPSVPHHPHIILAPARTWHPGVGLAMASLAGARGDELGASVVWCDGGSGAVNGVYGYGRGNRGLLIEEVGNGGKSWVATFGVPYNGGKDEERPKTVYASAGGSAALAFFAAILGVGWGAEKIFERLTAGGGSEDGEEHGLGLEHVQQLGGLVYPVLGRVIGYFRPQRERERERRPVPVGALVDA
ncbi:hypothetical protein FRC00_000551 [Tulasnella sp. 408]|nr:hypothetical protein FRC00_000551 [Tulasnella sp. 408]